ncbi:amino acid adenylation domain-containing protein [Thalassomonas viridans]|uniref:Amino acid adenylation domain-containing protein n=1 Tax=Thalassomonas viridans TaxID=137584 RepID=A0AAE9Z3K4_9GAMM|nr:non-ribosomal peptide synthetase [Thalassomonas viridans]WDE06111.1 amino acid adenylation domain-containing protein [Thalassomonas viridans]
MSRQLLQSCWQQGIRLSLIGENLGFKAAPGAMTPEIIADIKANKTALIELLKQEPDYFNARPLSANEQALWFLYQMQPDSVAYNMAYAVKLRPGHTEDNIQLAVDKLIQAHPILASHYGERDGVALQWLTPGTIAPLTIATINQGTQEDIDAWLNQQADERLAPDQGKTCHSALLCNQGEQGTEHYLILVVHHIAADFISFELLRRDLLRLLDKQEAAACQFPQYSYQDWLYEQKASREDEVYWLESLGDVPQLQLPTDFAHSLEKQSAGEEVQHQISNELTGKIRQACRELKVTPYLWWLASFQWFMARLSGQDDFIIGTPSAGRLKPEHNELVGYLVNPLALRCRIDKNMSFPQWLEQVKNQMQGAMKHQAYPFAALVDKLDFERTEGRSPVFQHMFTLNQLRQDDLVNKVLEQELLTEQRGAAHELNLVVVDDKTDFTCKWRYNNSLYRRETVETILQMFEHFAAKLADNNQQALKAFDITPPALAATLSGEQQPPKMQTAWHAFEQQLAQHSQAKALQSGPISQSYNEMAGDIRQQAMMLQQQGIKAGDRVGLCLERSINQVSLMFACWRLGASFVVLDPNWPEKRLSYIIDDAQLKLVIAQEAQPAALSATTAWLNLEKINNPIAQPLEPCPVKANDEAYVIYTSGSTGQPKGVAVSQKNLAYYVHGVMQQLDLTPDASMASLSAHSADLGYTALFGALLTGRTLRLLPESLALDTQALVNELNTRPLDCLKIVPSHLNGLLLASENDSVLPRQALICGGEAFSPQLVDKLHRLNPELTLYNHYGPTETTIGVLVNKIDPQHCQQVALGQPLANVQVKVVDVFGHTVAQNLPGELHIAGPTISQGYLNRPEQTADSFYQHQGQTWYRTGDAVVQRGQAIHYLGRTDFQVKIRGHRVEPGEIEHRLQLDIQDAVVVNKPEANGKNRLVAYVVATQAQIDAVREQMASELPAHMMPALWLAVPELPRLANGKVNRQQLPDPESLAEPTAPEADEQADFPINETEQTLLVIWQELLGQQDIGLNDDFFSLGGDSILGLQVIAKARKSGITLTPQQLFQHKTISKLAQIGAPQEQAQTLSDNEKTLLTIVRQVLGKEDFGVKDNFFASGGDSILSLQVVAGARKAGINILPKDIFKHKTIAALAAQLPEAEQANDKVSSAPRQEKAFALTPIQHWFFEQKLKKPQHWNQALLLNGQQDMDIDALRRATALVLQRHPSLSLAFEQEGNIWMQKYQAYQPSWPEQVVKLASESPLEEVLTRYQSEFELQSAPLLRIVYFPTSKQLLLSAHHLIVDAVSWQIILEDLFTLYRRIKTGKTPELAGEGGDFALWQQALEKQTEVYNQEALIRYWQDQLDKESVAPQEKNSDNTYGNSRHYNLSLDESLTSALLTTACQSYNSQIQELLITALVQVLGQWLEQEKITIELEGHGRESGLLTGADKDRDLSATTGWFTSRYPQKFTAHSEPEQAIISVKEQLRNIPDNGLSYGLLRYLGKNSGKSLGTDLTGSNSQWGHSSLVSLNYLGQQRQQDNQEFSLSQMLCPGMRADENQRPHLLDINAVVIQGVLHLDWCYPGTDPKFAGVPELAQEFKQQLINIIRHCSQPSVGRATAADFPNAGINDSQFIDLLSELMS